MTSKTLTRQRFLQLSVRFAGATAVLGAFGCPSGDDTGDDGAGSSGGPGSTGGSSGDGSTSSTPSTTSGPGEESSGGPGDSSGGSICGTGADADIATNHGHSLFVPIADLEAGVEVTYDITGTSAHPHMVTLTPDQLTMILEGMSVVVQSTEDNAHTHEVTISC